MTSSSLESYLHYKIWDAPPVRKRKAKAKHWRRGPVRNWKYRAWIRSLPCAICGRTPSEAAHTGSDHGLRQKASDYTCVPLCTFCHTFGPHSYHILGRRAFEAFHALGLENTVEQLKALWFQYGGMVK